MLHQTTPTTDTTDSSDKSKNQRAWLAQFNGSGRAMTPAGAGTFNTITPLSVQFERGRIGVVLDSTNTVSYFDPEELAPTDVPEPKRQRTWQEMRV